MVTSATVSSTSSIQYPAGYIPIEADTFEGQELPPYGVAEHLVREGDWAQGFSYNPQLPSADPRSRRVALLQHDFSTLQPRLLALGQSSAEIFGEPVGFPGSRHLGWSAYDDGVLDFDVDSFPKGGVLWGGMVLLKLNYSAFSDVGQKSNGDIVISYLQMMAYCLQLTLNTKGEFIFAPESQLQAKYRLTDEKAQSRNPGLQQIQERRQTPTAVSLRAEVSADGHITRSIVERPSSTPLGITTNVMRPAETRQAFLMPAHFHRAVVYHHSHVPPALRYMTQLPALAQLPVRMGILSHG